MTTSEMSSSNDIAIEELHETQEEWVTIVVQAFHYSQERSTNEISALYAVPSLPFSLGYILNVAGYDQ